MTLIVKTQLCILMMARLSKEGKEILSNNIIKLAIVKMVVLKEEILVLIQHLSSRIKLKKIQMTHLVN